MTFFRTSSLKPMLWICLLSTVLSAGAAALQLRDKYLRDVNVLQRDLDRLPLTDLAPLATTLAHADTDLLQVQVQGLANRPHIVHAKVLHSKNMVTEAGTIRGKTLIQREFPLELNVHGQTQHLGRLIVTASLDTLDAHAKDEFFTILGHQLLIALLLGTALVVLFHTQIGRHLAALARQVRHLPSSDFRTPILLRKPSRGDEIDQIASALEDLRTILLTTFSSLNLEIEKRAATERALSQTKEQAEAVFLAKSQFLANMSHEIRTPMNGVLGMLQLALDSRDHHIQTQYLHAALQSAQSLLRLLNDILDLSRLEVSRMPVLEEEFNLRVLLRELQDGFQAAVLDRGLELHVAVDANIPECLRGDPLRIRQILTNLISNAVKFTVHGRVDVEISALPSQHPDIHRVFFEIRDTGVGIPEELQPRLFEAFSQDPSGRRRKFGGTGLGLSITNQLVTLLKGSMAFVSDETGTVFAVLLPLHPGFPQDTPDAPRTTVHRPTRPLHVLVAEDDPTNSTIALKFLEKLGHTAALAGTGTEALALLQENTFDLVLMDIQMPEMDGMEATRAIRSWPKEQGGGIPIVAMTAHAFSSDTERFLQGGMNAHLPKPISLDDLGALLESLPLTANHA